MEVFKTNFKHEKWIEAQSLLRTASEHYAKNAPAGPNSPERLLASLLVCIENAPSGKNIPAEWIAVKDRLPEMNVRVLVFRDGGFALSEICMNDLDGNPMWDYTGLGGDPLYWMPLPEPPAE